MCEHGPSSDDGRDQETSKGQPAGGSSWWLATVFRSSRRNAIFRRTVAPDREGGRGGKPGSRTRPAVRLASLLTSTLTVVALGACRATPEGFSAQSSPGAGGPVENYLYTPQVDLATLAPMIQRPDIKGVQVLYRWKSLEPREGAYDFSQIEKDLQYLDREHKKLFIQLQDRSFTPKPAGIPPYLLTNPTYRGGAAPQYDDTGKVIGGWVAEQWVPAVRDRFQALITALAKRFDGKVAGINLPESSVAVDPAREHARSGYTCDGLVNSAMDNLRFARAAFRRSSVVQYVNFWCGSDEASRQYMSRTFETAEKNGIGLGGPDVLPWKPFAMQHSAYPYFHQDKGKLNLVAMAVQEPDLSYINPRTGKPSTREEFTRFATDYLGANIIFWATSSPWLHQKQTSSPATKP
jgi:hypothetical protein